MCQYRCAGYPRPWQSGKSVYNYIDARTGAEVKREQSYNSSPMEQMLAKCVALENAWHSLTEYVRPAKLRLQAALRRCKIKCDLESDVIVDGDARSVGKVAYSKCKATPETSGAP